MKMDYRINFNCSFCDALVPFNLVDASKHVKTHSNRCPICRDQLTAVELENEGHLRRLHRVGAQTPTPSTNHFHTCSICAMQVPVFPRGSNLHEDNILAARRHYMEHFESNHLRPEFQASQQHYLCPYPTCFKVFNHRSTVYACFFIHSSEDLPISSNIEISNQVHSPPSVTNLIGNPVLASTQVATASDGPEEPSQPQSIGSQPQNEVGSPGSPPSPGGGGGALEEVCASVSVRNANGNVAGNLEVPSTEESLAKLFYQLRCLHGVPEDGLTLLSSTLKGIDEEVQRRVNSLVSEELLRAAVPSDAATCVSQRVRGRMEEESLLYTSAFSSKYKRRKYFEQQYPIVHPIFVRVPQAQLSPPRYYVRFDLADLLKRFFCDQDVKDSFQAFSEVQQDFLHIATRARDDGMAEDIRLHCVTEGRRYREKCGARTKPIIPLILYLDAFGTNDPAGSKSSLHKIMGVYVGVAASPICYSERKSILLFSIVRQEEIKSLGVHHFLEDLLNDIDLARTQDFQIGGKEVGVDLLYVLGDNLEANVLSGLGGGFSRWVKHVCRHCEITSDEFCKVGSYREMKEKSTPRTHDGYLRHQGTYLQTRNKSLSKGVVSRSALQDFQGIDIAKDLPSCVIHNFLGGECRTPFAMYRMIPKYWRPCMSGKQCIGLGIAKYRKPFSNIRLQ